MAQLSELRGGSTEWHVGIVNGLNLSNSARLAPQRFGASSGLKSIEDLRDRVCSHAHALGLIPEWFVSNFEGEILEWVHAAPDRLHGIIINPGGLTSFGAATRQALSDTGLPVIECHFANLAKHGRSSIFTPGVTGQVQGLRHHSYTAALVAMAGILDDESANTD